MVILYFVLALVLVILARTLMFTPPKADQRRFEEIQQEL